MRHFIKSILILIFIAGNIVSSFADRGIGKKSKNKVLLNISAGTSFQNSLSFNLKTGLKYKGSILKEFNNESRSFSTTNLITYQKGNTIYIVPNKQKIVIPEIKPGYTGIKLIIQPG